MYFSGYCFKFILNATHSILIDKARSSQHAHNWEISVYFNKSDDSFIEFYELENLIENRLDYFQLKNLNSLSEFQSIEPTLENIGDVLYVYLNNVVSCYNCIIFKMEISETPLRTYVINDVSDLNGDFTNRNDYSRANPLLISNILQNVTEMVSNMNTVSSYLSDKEKNILGEKVQNTLQEVILDTNKNKNLDDEVSRDKIKKYYIFFYLKIISAITLLLFATYLLLLYVNRNGQAPWGSDAFGHLFKADLLYNSIKNGDYFPLYTKLWYNGIQPFRYWAPLPYYFVACLSF